MARIGSMVAPEHIYAAYSVPDGTPPYDIFRSLPVLMLAANVDANGELLGFTPYVWDPTSPAGFKDARTLPNFLGIVRTHSFEAHYQAAESDINAALETQHQMSRDSREALVSDYAAQLLAKLAAYKRVRAVLATKLPPVPA